jgi:hypothetical protein
MQEQDGHILKANAPAAKLHILRYNILEYCLTCLSFASKLAIKIVISPEIYYFILQCCTSYISHVTSIRNHTMVANRQYGRTNRKL